MRMPRCRVLGLMAIAAICRGAEPVRLTAQPQKFRTFYSLDDPRVPAALKPPGATARAVASDGAVWYGTQHGVTRIDPNAPPRDRSQYFAGKRYLPDDEVQQLAADQAAQKALIHAHAGELGWARMNFRAPIRRSGGTTELLNKCTLWTSTPNLGNPDISWLAAP